MIEFISLDVADFMSFGEEHLDFEPMEAILLGINRDSAGADDNGAGKSSLAEAIRWAIYGETVRSAIDKSLPVEHIIRKGATRASVTLILRVNGLPLEITRTRTKSKGTLSVVYGGNPHEGKAAQDTIDGCVGIDVVQFSNLVHLDGSYPRLFAPSTDRDRKEILADLVDVAIAEQMKTEADKRLRPLLERIVQIEKDITRAQWTIEQETTKMADNAEVAKQSYEAAVAADEQLKKYKRALKKVKEEVKWLEEEEDNLGDSNVIGLNALNDQLALVVSKVENWRVKLENAQDFFKTMEIEEATKRIDSTQYKINRNVERITEIKRLQGSGKCPTCGQDTGELHATEVQALTSQTKELKDEVLKLKDARQSLEEERKELIDGLRQDIREQKEYERTIRAEMATVVKEAESGRKEVQAKLRKTRGRLIEAERNVTATTKERDAHRELVTEAHANRLVAKSNRALAEEACDAAIEEKAKLESTIEDLEFWKKGFGPKGVPSLFIETVLPAISARIQKYADILTGGDVIVTLKAYAETKSGTVKESIQISAVNSKGASVYGSNSTGERNRINMSVTLGLIEYFRDMGVFESNLLICDEIFDGLDSTGVEHGLEALREAGIGTTIVISHHDHLRPLFTEAMFVQKENGVSKLIRS